MGMCRAVPAAAAVVPEELRGCTGLWAGTQSCAQELLAPGQSRLGDAAALTEVWQSGRIWGGFMLKTLGHESRTQRRGGDCDSLPLKQERSWGL